MTSEEKEKKLQHSLKCMACKNTKEKPWHMVCAKCWDRLPSEMQDDVYLAYKEEEGSPRHRELVLKCYDFLRCCKQPCDASKDREIGRLKNLAEKARVLIDAAVPDVMTGDQAKAYRDYLEATGEHWVCGEYGWMPAHMNTREHTGCEPEEVLDEVNNES
jgi:hypothetical protein